LAAYYDVVSFGTSRLDYISELNTNGCGYSLEKYR
jgi:hypothetical protein